LWISEKDIDFGRAEMAGIDFNDPVAALPIETNFIDALAVPFDGLSNGTESQLHKFTHRSHPAP
jgi:hypothetical protein